MEKNQIMENDNYKTNRQKIYLAALLHDIGKFYQRADDKNAKESKLLSEQTKKLESIYCPKNKGYYSHKHVLWTAQFFEDFEKQFRALTNNDDKETSVFKLATSHHNPDENALPELIIQRADWYSSGVDRSSDEYSIQDGLKENDREAFKKKRLLSVFEGLANNKQDFEYALPVEALSLKTDFFPKRINEFTSVPDYKSLWERFIKDFKIIQTVNYRVFAETTLNLLKKYTVNIPSSTMHLPDVSLYDHLKTSAGFAVCLLDYLEQEDVQNKSLAGIKNKNPFILIGGDLSGIQDFIYDVISKNAAKNLKGRSFYIQLLTESITHKILHELKLFKANLIYDAGGNFYILAPNTEEVKTKLSSLKEDFINMIFNAHGSSIYLAIDHIAFGEQEILKGGVATVWEKLQYKLDISKNQKYKSKIADDFNSFFSPAEIGGKQIRDVITGEEISDSEIQENEVKYLDTDNKDPIKLATFKQIELGKQLRQSDFRVKSNEPLNYWSGEHEHNPAGLGVYYYFLSKSGLEKYASELKSSADNVELISINDSLSETEGEIEFIHSLKGLNNIYSFDFYGGNKFPSYEETEVDEDGVEHLTGEPKTFDKLCGNEGFRRLGVLRMDVDNLGDLFAKGFKNRHRTFSRLLALSRNLDYFFKGYLNTIWKQEKYKNESIILYSGGDDLFIVGRWNKLIDMAKEIKQNFAAFTCHNSKLSISGGMAIVGPKYPILKGADQAAEAEHQAKQYENNDANKNAFYFFNNAFNWEIEYHALEELKNLIVKYTNEETGLPGAFIGNVQKFAANRQLQINKQRNESWQWQMAYSLSRMAKRIKSDEIKQFVNRIKNDVFANYWEGKSHHFKYETIEILNVAARWAEFEIRTK
ncbi:MAG: type III-A CRISPR-associated protein Cas10/Csm1 [Bacteroidales bacterium]|nr:type III-A CRISPR-associated protein Cas10/Csm1 [Bacteroidales bacterium]MCF8387704.1 type III-A CRISPR-associated protein Cas10/Csm1 [Bacteroidales bacterium]MCF8398512.1 type III-A CRISPR-associated protein Cas10/Csm1 [Bacteroidales bacterium]